MLGKAAGASVRALVQAVLLLIVVAIAGIGAAVDASWACIGALAMLMLGTAGFACAVDAASRPA